MQFRHLFTASCFALVFGGVTAQVMQQEENTPSSTESQPLDLNDVKNRYIIRIPKNKRDKKGIRFQSLKTGLVTKGVKVELVVEEKGILAVTLPDSFKAVQLESLATQFGVSIVPDEVGYIMAPEDLPYEKDESLKGGDYLRKLAESSPWGIGRIYEGQGIPSSNYFNGLGEKKICIIDSGYLISHEDLPNDASAVTQSMTDSPGCRYHGSHVAGTIGAIGGNNKGVIGVFPGAPNMKIAKLRLTGCTSMSSSLIQSLQGCANSGADIISMSFGSSSPQLEDTFREFYEDDGILLVASSGNNGPNSIGYPAGFSSVVSVGSTDINDKIARNSSTNNQVDISAPGVSVRSTVGPNNNSYGWKSGTSMAAPHVSGAALVLWNKFPTCTNKEIRTALEQSAKDLGSPGRDNAYGHGRLRYWNAVTYLEQNPCGGGGGGGGGSCTDNPLGWHDSDGPRFNCAWYDVGSNCELFGNGWENDGFTANQACCACGGGSSGGGPNGNFVLLNPSTGKALDVQGSKCDNGTNIHLWSRNDSGAQIFRYDTVTKQIINVKCNKAVDLAWGSNGSACDPGRNIHLWSRHSQPNQKWDLEPNNKIRSVQCPNMVIDIEGWNTRSNGANIEAYIDNANWDKVWKVTNV